MTTIVVETPIEATVITVGDVGPPGAKGQTGATGPTGDTGATGPAGATGPQGAQGPIGLMGPPGADGEDGADGATGADGEDGADGATGPVGAQGAPGLIGPAGAPGLDGADGAEGPAGATGPQGAQGPIGPAGPPGLDGEDGAEGPSGLVGSTGATGPPGPAGPSGFDGEDGEDGPAGAPGGVGLQGPVGPMGPPGLDGQDGEDGSPGPPGLEGPQIPAALPHFIQAGSSPERWYAGVIANDGMSTAFGGGTPTFTIDVLRAWPFFVAESIVIDRIGVKVQIAVATSKVRVGIYNATSRANLYPSTLIVDSGEIDCASTGVKSSTISTVLVGGRLYWFAQLGGTANARLGCPGPPGLCPILGLDSNLEFMGIGWTVSLAYGALPDPFTPDAPVMSGSAPLGVPCFVRRAA